MLPLKRVVAIHFQGSSYGVGCLLVCIGLMLHEICMFIFTCDWVVNLGTAELAELRSSDGYAESVASSARDLPCGVHPGV